MKGNRNRKKTNKSDDKIGRREIKGKRNRKIDKEGIK